MAARRARSRRSAAVMPPSWEPRTMRSGSPSAAISSSMAMFTASPLPPAPGRSVRGRQRLGALDGEDGLADRNGPLAGLGAEELQAEVVVAVALAQLRAAVKARYDALGRRRGVGGQERVATAAQVDRIGGGPSPPHLTRGE